MEKRLARSNADIESEIVQRQAKEEKVMDLEKRLTIIRLEMQKMTMKCDAAEKGKSQVSIKQ